MRKILFYTIVTFFLFSCDTEKTISISTQIENVEVERIVLSNSLNMVHDTIKNLNGDPYSMSIEQAGVYQLGEGRNVQYIFLSPGSSIKISNTSQRPGYTITGDQQAEQELLVAFSKEMSIASNKFSLGEMGDTTQAEFLLRLDERYEKVNAMLAKKKAEGVSEHLIGLLEGRIEADEAQTKIYYPEYYKYLKKKEAVLSEDYYAFSDSFDYNNEGLFQFDDVKYAALTVLAKDVNFEDYEDMALYYSDQYRLVDGLETTPKIAELLKFNILNDKINYSGGVSGMDEEIQNFIENAIDPNRILVMKKAVSSWAHLKVGKKAPDFSALTRDGKEVKLSDLKGENVYIDVWATWCGPCIAEIPSLKLMEKKYHGENVKFVSVSIDKESDREKWKKFIEEKDLGGTQIMADAAGSSKLSSQYNISGIPRFIMVNASGAIVNVDAPRPSNAVAFDKMMGTVLN